MLLLDKDGWYQRNPICLQLLYSFMIAYFLRSIFALTGLTMLLANRQSSYFVARFIETIDKATPRNHLHNPLQRQLPNKPARVFTLDVQKSDPNSFIALNQQQNLHISPKLTLYGYGLYVQFLLFQPCIPKRLINHFFMKIFCAILLALVAVISCQTPPSWGGNPRYTVKVKMLNDDPVANWNFLYYYDWSLKAERYEHESPQEDEMCLLPTTSFTKDKVACVVTFATDGWSYISFPSQNFCCKCSKSFGAIRYDWLQQNSNYVGIETIDGKSVTHWTKQGQFLNDYYSTVDKALPVRFFEIKNGHPKSWDFDLSTYSTGPIDPDKFKPQCTTPCVGYCSQLVQEEEGNLQTQ